MYLYWGLNDPADIRYLGTSTIEHGMWYCPGPGTKLSNLLSLFSEPNLNDWPVFNAISYWPGPGTFCRLILFNSSSLFDDPILY